MEHNIKRSGECARCGECCKKTRISSILSHCLRQHGGLEEIKKYYSFRNIQVAGFDKEADRIYLEMDVNCSMLDKNNHCKLHESPEIKPYICHRYPWFKDDIETCGFKFPH